MFLNNLDENVAQHPYELGTYGGNGQVFNNWAQMRIAIKMLQEIIVNLQNENRITICICDHQARDLLACVDVAMILSNGKIIAQDTPSNLVKDINAKNAYFGDNFKFN